MRKESRVQDIFNEKIKNGRFEDALEMIILGEDTLKSAYHFRLPDSYKEIIKNKAYDILDKLVEMGFISLDILEYNTFSGSIFEQLILYIGNKEEDYKFFKEFLSKVPNLNVSIFDETLLGHAFRLEASVTVVELMINQGCNIHYTNRYNENFTHLLARNSANLELLKLCVKYDVNIDKKSISGDTPAHYCMRLNNLKAVLLLASNGADMNIANNENHTVYHLAIDGSSDFDFLKDLNYYCSIEAKLGNSFIE